MRALSRAANPLERHARLRALSRAAMLMAPNFRDLQYRFAAHLRDPARNPPPEGIEDRRLAVYRDLFLGNVSGFLKNAFPVLRETLGETAFEALVRDWFAEYQARSPLFPAMPREFVDYLAQAREARPGDPPWLAELAHYEWVELALDLDEAELDGPGGAPDDPLAAVPALSPLAWPLAYAWPVHRIGPEFQPASPPGDPSLLVVYRDREFEIGFLEINPVTWRLLELAGGGDGLNGRELLIRIGNELGYDDPETLLEPGRSILDEMYRRDILT